MVNLIIAFLLLVGAFVPASDTPDIPLKPISVDNAAQLTPLAVWEDVSLSRSDVVFNVDLTGFLIYDHDLGELTLWSVGDDHQPRQIHATPAIRYAIRHQHVAYQISADDPILHLWDLSTGRELAPFENAAPSTPLAWNADATRLAYVTDKDTIVVSDILTRERLYQNHLDGSMAQALSFIAPSDDLLIQTHRNTGITLNTIGFGEQRSGFFLQTPIQRFASILFSPDQSTVFLTEEFYRSGENGLISITDVWGEYSSYIGTFEGGGLGFLPNGLLYSSTSVGGPSRERTLTLRDPDTLDIRKTFVYGGAVQTSARGWMFSPDGARLVTETWNYAAEGGNASPNYTYTVWDVESGEPIATVAPSEAAGRMMLFSPDSTVFVTVGGQNIALWDAQTGDLLTTLTGHTDFVKTLAFSSDGTRVVSISDDGTIRVWGITPD